MTPSHDPEVLIVGAGPVGLLAALSLKMQGVDVEIIDQDPRGSRHSYALAIHPRTLGLLDEMGLASSLIPQGRRLERVAFFEGSSRRAAVDLSKLPGKHPFVLVLRQDLFERALEEELDRRKVHVSWNHRLQAVEQQAGGAEVEIAKLDQVSTGYAVQRSDWVVVKTWRRHTKFVVGADGHDSSVRRLCGIETEDLGGGVLVSVFEIEAKGELPEEVRVLLDPDLTSVYWPLEPGRCRFSFQIRAVSEHEPTLERFRALVAARAPWFAAEPTSVGWSTFALFERRLARRFGHESVWLAGDAAHLATPVGVHSMNLGLWEARDLAGRLGATLRAGAARETLGDYETRARAEWRPLFGGDNATRALPDATPWAIASRSRILASLPASGDDLDLLLRQIGLSITTS